MNFNIGFKGISKVFLCFITHFRLESMIPFKVAIVNNILLSNAFFEKREEKCFRLGGLNKLSLIYL